jgi:hypothetical protein
MRAPGAIAQSRKAKEVMIRGQKLRTGMPEPWMARIIALAIRSSAGAIRQVAPQAMAGRGGSPGAISSPFGPIRLNLLRCRKFLTFI